MLGYIYSTSQASLPLHSAKLPVTRFEITIFESGPKCREQLLQEFEEQLAARTSNFSTWRFTTSEAIFWKQCSFFSVLLWMVRKWLSMTLHFLQTKLTKSSNSHVFVQNTQHKVYNIYKNQNIEPVYTFLDPRLHFHSFLILLSKDVFNIPPPVTRWAFPNSTVSSKPAVTCWMGIAWWWNHWVISMILEQSRLAGLILTDWLIGLDVWNACLIRCLIDWLIDWLIDSLSYSHTPHLPCQSKNSPIFIQLGKDQHGAKPSLCKVNHPTFLPFVSDRQSSG